MHTRRAFIQQTALIGVVAAAFVPIAHAVAQTALAVPRATMKTYKIPNTELVVSRIAYGTALVGTEQNSEFFPKLVRGIRTAYDNGITFFDLADVYGKGQSESALGEVLKGSTGLRNRIIIQSKCGLIPDGGGIDLSRKHIASAVEGSLKRLGTDHLDILLLHSSDPLVEPEEVARAFDDLHQNGKVRHFGVSNFGIAQIELLKKSVRQPLVANQIRLGLAYAFPLRQREYEGKESLVDYCRLHEIQVQAYSPLRVGGDLRKPPSLFNPPDDASPELKRAAQALLDLAKEKNSNPSAIALAWLLRHPAGIVPIIGATVPQYIIQNCAADRVALTRAEWYGLSNATVGIQPDKLQ